MSDDATKRKTDFGAALAEMPVFPLGEVALFPNALLPLHVFEPRYRTMVSECLASHGAMAIANVPDATDVDENGNPRIARIAGAGVIVGHEPLKDGRSNIVLRGIERVVLEELPFRAPYRRARAQVVATLDTASESEKMALVAAASAFAAAVRKHDSSFSFEVPTDLDAGALADVCAHHLLVDPAARQGVLEERDAGARARAVTSELLVQQKTLFGAPQGAPN